MFPLHLGEYIFHYTMLNWWHDHFQYLTDHKNLLFSLPGIYICCCVLFTLTLGRIWNLFSHTQFPDLFYLIVLLWNQDHKPDYICIKISITTYSTSFYCHRVTNSANFTNISIVLKGESPQYFILFPLISCSLFV